ncbi:MAG: hypothetical protein M3Y21_00235 [Candidatus Eremiobacteraeota bacterium]|nr:hypothetical protein [Candidatus Eremiobacteraeota bacterium]
MQITKIRNLIAAALLSVAMFGAGAAFTSGAKAAIIVTNPVVALRGERGSAVNMLYVRRRVESLIDQLQRDRRDYGGHRLTAIADLQQARNEIIAAISYDSTHGH